MNLAEVLQRYKYHLLGVAVLAGSLYVAVLPRMVLQWYGDGNYSHCFLVPLLAGFFLFERRKELARTPVAPWTPGLAVVALALAQLLLGSLAGELFTERSSLVVLLAGLVLYLFGRGVFRGALLPLGYLVLMVPLPYIVYDLAAFPLRLFVSRVSVGFLQLFGILVQRDGNVIVFPTIVLEVADACSGLRSLMSLLALGIAYAFFLPISPLKRVLLILCALPVAIFANAARVIMTGFLAQYWGAQAAQGFFHEFAGLLVFALALALLLGIGALFQEEGCGTQPVGGAPVTPATPGGTPGLTRRILAVWVLLGLFGAYQLSRGEPPAPPKRPFSGFPVEVNGWRELSRDTLDSQTLETLKPTDYLSRSYVDRDGAVVRLYLGYHGGGPGAGEIHSPKHCLPGSGWLQLSSQRSWVDCAQGRVNLVQAVYALGGSRELFYYWFQVRDRTLSDEYALKWAEMVNALLSRRRDATFVRITAATGLGGRRAPESAERFIRDFYPVIRGFLPR